ncbi:hypothetical protein DERP_000161 [Dermatophagoides pteronyssinus]|uniref:Uncharacterized protein n=1 Tax=Dermatophagoides pteronyssinus TaxID=6956 RepID=A0ABQ8IZE2_DERPT|nr:hypothetical protein DERP_000161 [Dermatophagoides pteronyssinus]
MYPKKKNRKTSFLKLYLPLVAQLQLLNYSYEALAKNNQVYVKKDDCYDHNDDNNFDQSK